MLTFTRSESILQELTSRVKQCVVALINDSNGSGIRSINLNTFHFHTQLVVTDLSLSHN